MADDMTVGGIGTQKIDLTKWKKLSPQEIIREQGKGEEIPAEIITWAQQMLAYANMPDNVTYEQVDGDVGIEALNKLGIEEEPPVAPEDENSQDGVEPEEPGAIREPGRTDGEDDINDNIFAAALPGQAADEPAVNNDEDNQDFANDDFSLADTELTTDPDEIRKRKERKGIQT